MVRPREKENFSRVGNSMPWELRQEDSVGRVAGRGRDRSARLHLGEEPWGLGEVWGSGRGCCGTTKARGGPGGGSCDVGRPGFVRRGCDGAWGKLSPRKGHWGGGVYRRKETEVGGCRDERAQEGSQWGDWTAEMLGSR